WKSSATNAFGTTNQDASCNDIKLLVCPSTPSLRAGQFVNDYPVSDYIADNAGAVLVPPGSPPERYRGFWFNPSGPTDFERDAPRGRRTRLGLVEGGTGRAGVWSKGQVPCTVYRDFALRPAPRLARAAEAAVLKILLVEDNEINLDMIVRRLRKRFDIAVART